MPAIRNRSDVLVRLVARWDTAAAMPTRPALPTRFLRALLVLLVALVVTAGAVPAAVAAAPKPAPGPGKDVRARYAVLVDPATGAVLWGRRSRTPAPPASLTKMLTALAVRASLELDTVTVASKAAGAQPARRLAVRRGQELTVEQALKALMIVSANDVAVMLAEAAGGSVPRFARAMDAESARLGLRASSWRNPNGLDAPGHRSTAFDLAILARAVLQDPWLARVVRKRHAAFVSPSGRRHSLTARSRFLLGYRGAVGVKTGFTDDAGHCLAAAATRGGRTLIAVVLHSPTTPPTPGGCSTGASPTAARPGPACGCPTPCRRPAWPPSSPAHPGPSSATIRPSPGRWPRPAWPGSGRPRRPGPPARDRPGPGRTASGWPPAPVPSSRS
jgi:D-alanyl-D-alanine carboxypeptidase